MTYREYKEAIEKDEKNLRDISIELLNKNDEEISIKKDIKLTKRLYEEEKIKNNKLKDEEYKIKNFEEIKKEEKRYSIFLFILYETIILVISLLTLLLPGIFPVFFTSATVFLTTCCVYRYIKLIEPIIKSKKQVETGKYNLGEKIYFSDRKMKELDKKLKNLNQKLDDTFEEIKNLQTLKIDIYSDLTNKKDFLNKLMEEISEINEFNEIFNNVYDSSFNDELDHGQLTK